MCGGQGQGKVVERPVPVSQQTSAVWGPDVSESSSWRLKEKTGLNDAVRPHQHLCRASSLELTACWCGSVCACVCAAAATCGAQVSTPQGCLSAGWSGGACPEHRPNLDKFGSAVRPRVSASGLVSQRASILCRPASRWHGRWPDARSDASKGQSRSPWCVGFDCPPACCELQSVT